MALKTLEKHWSKGLIVSICCILFFIFFLTLSMFFYPDGLSSIGYNGFDGYSFWNNFISDLGMTHTFGGIPNPISSLFLLIGIIILSISSLLFYLLIFIVFNLDKEDRTVKKLSKMGSLFGILGGIFLLGISIFPKDTELLLHEIFSILFFLLTFIAVLFYNRIIIITKNISNKYTIFGYFFIICGFIYAIVPKVLFPQLDDETQSIFKPTSQKIVVISLLIAMVNYIILMNKLKISKYNGNLE